MIGQLSRKCQPLMAVVALATLSTLGVTPLDAAEQEALWPSPEWSIVEPAAVGLDAAELTRAKDYALSAGGSGMIVWRGRVVSRWGDQNKRYDIKSATKSIGATMLGIAVKDGKIDLKAPARNYHPRFGVPPRSNARTGWLAEITILQLATQTAGFDKRGGYEKLLFRPGTRWRYSDGGPNWLAECITLQYKRDLEDVMFDRVFTPLGITRDDLRWRNNQYRPHEIQGIPRREFGSGVHANVDALARIGYLYLRKGRWKDKQILPAAFVKKASRPVETVVGLPEWEGDPHGNASDHYGLLWWNNADGTMKDVPRDAFWAWGLYDSLIVVIPSLDLVAVRGGERRRSWPRTEGAGHYDVLQPFLEPIVATVESAKQTTPKRQNTNIEKNAPYPASDVITGITWDPPESIVRLARGSDNWPITWADDGALYTAYGDGRGFQPYVPEKLSMGLARVTGLPPDIEGANIRSSFIEEEGNGARGKKASGILMVEGVLYLWVRNADNSQLAWSADYGRSWTWADWKFTTSFGCPTFLNFGKNYAGACDEYVYIYSPDSQSAYQPADRMVLARVPQDQITDRSAYQFFQQQDNNGQPRWTENIDERGAVFSHPGRCYRSGISYNDGLDRYLWCQIYPESAHPRGVRYSGGFGIYDAPAPWGPWTTVYHTNDWDVGPGETSSFPTKWMSKNGRRLYLVFSGDDCFSVRGARLTTALSAGH